METGEHRPELSVIIVTWNAASFLAPCLDALENALADVRHEVIVVDNGSTDETVALLVARGFQEPGETEGSTRVLIRNAENRGFAAANNQGLALARAPFVLFLNPDTEARPKSITTLLTFLKQHPEVVAVGPKLVLADGSVQGGAAGHEPTWRTLFNYAFGLYLLAPQRFPGLWLARRQYATPDPIAVDWVSGAALMTRTEAARAVGGWPEAYFLYVEDIAFCRRLREHGSIVCLPAAEIVHYIGQSVHQQGTRGLERNILGLDRDYRSRYGPLQVVMLHLLGGLGFGLRWMAALLSSARSPRGHSAPARVLWKTCTLTSLKCAWQALTHTSPAREESAP